MPAARTMILYYKMLRINFKFVFVTVHGQGYNDHTCADDRSVIVHMFNWLWTDIEKECADYLGPKGFCGVQVRMSGH